MFGHPKLIGRTGIGRFLIQVSEVLCHFNILNCRNTFGEPRDDYRGSSMPPYRLSFLPIENGTYLGLTWEEQGTSLSDIKKCLDYYMNTRNIIFFKLSLHFPEEP